MVKLTLKEKNDFTKKQIKNYGDYDSMPNNIQKKYLKYANELANNRKKIEDELDEIDEKENYTNVNIPNYIKLIRRYEIFSLDEIPELKKHKKEDSESDEESHKPLTIAQQNKIIRQIPDDTFTRKEIEQIIKHIRDGSMVDVEQMPNPTKKQPKVKLSDVVIDKKKK